MPEPSYCSTLMLTTFNGTIKAVEEEKSNSTTTNITTSSNPSSSNNDFDTLRRRICSQIKKLQPNGTPSYHAVTSSDPNVTSSESNATSSPVTSHLAMLDINSERFRFIVFNGSVNTLQFSMLVPQSNNGFQLYYEVMRKPYTRRRKTRNSPWYLVYAPLIFYLPIGLTLGFGIIMFQNVRHPRDLKIKTFPDRGNYSTATSLVDSVMEKSTPKSAIRSIMKRSKSLDANRLSDCSYTALSPTDFSVVGIHQGNKNDSAGKSPPFCRQNVDVTVDKPVGRKVTFKKPSIDQV